MELQDINLKLEDVLYLVTCPDYLFIADEELKGIYKLASPSSTMQRLKQEMLSWALKSSKSLSNAHSLEFKTSLSMFKKQFPNLWLDLKRFGLEELVYKGLTQYFETCDEQSHNVSLRDACLQDLKNMKPTMKKPFRFRDFLLYVVLQCSVKLGELEAYTRPEGLLPERVHDVLKIKLYTPFGVKKVKAKNAFNADLNNGFLTVHGMRQGYWWIVRSLNPDNDYDRQVIEDLKKLPDLFSEVKSIGLEYDSRVLKGYD